RDPAIQKAAAGDIQTRTERMERKGLARQLRQIDAERLSHVTVDLGELDPDIDLIRGRDGEPVEHRAARHGAGYRGRRGAYAFRLAQGADGTAQHQGLAHPVGPY